jgi:uncharacterized protein GlcG (DUF336 family)
MDPLATAKSLAEYVGAEAAKDMVPVSVCIVDVDVDGNPMPRYRMTAPPLFSLEISDGKAYTSALVGLRTADLLALVQAGQSLYVFASVAGGRVCPMGGGVPLTDNGQVFAGIGVSGGTAGQDADIAEVALP